MREARNAHRQKRATPASATTERPPATVWTNHSSAISSLCWKVSF